MIYIDQKDGKKILVKFNDSSMVNVLPAILKQVDIIGENAFRDNLDIVSVLIPDNVKEIKSGAFQGCQRLGQIRLPSGLEKIAPETFKDCLILSSLELPSSVKDIGFSAFEGCQNLSDINLPKHLRAIGANAFENCYRLNDIKLPPNVMIGGSAFKSSGLITITIPKNARLTDSHTFANSDLCEATIQGGSIIPYSCFDGCKLLEIVDLPPTLKTIQGRAFADCKSLYNVDLPEGLINICCEAFNNSGVASVGFPESLEHIYKDAFTDCRNLLHVDIPHDDIDIKTDAFDKNTTVNYLKENRRLFQYLLDKIQQNSDLKTKDKRHIMSLIQFIIEDSGIKRPTTNYYATDSKQDITDHIDLSELNDDEPSVERENEANLQTIDKDDNIGNER